MLATAPTRCDDGVQVGDGAATRRTISHTTVHTTGSEWRLPSPFDSPLGRPPTHNHRNYAH